MVLFLLQRTEGCFTSQTPAQTEQVLERQTEESEMRQDNEEALYSYILLMKALFSLNFFKTQKPLLLPVLSDDFRTPLKLILLSFVLNNVLTFA